MSVNQETASNASSADQDPSGIDGEVETTVETASTESHDDFVKRETFQKSVAQEKNLRQRLKDSETRLKELEAEKNAGVEKSLAEQNEYKKLYETYKAKSETLQGDMDNFNESLIDGHKLQAVLDKLPGKVKSRDYYRYIDLKSIAYDPETKSIDEESVTLAANKFLSERAELLDTKEKKRLPNDAPATKVPKSLGDLTLSEQLALAGNLITNN